MFMPSTMQPIFILPEDTKRSTGRDAQSNNIAAAKAVAATVRTTLGPKGMDKMIVDSSGDVIITNDGVTILQEMKIEHPAARMVVEVAKTQEDAVGDGTTTAVVLAGELLKKAEELLEQDVHPTILAKGYRMAETEAQAFLQKAAENVSLDDEALLRNIALTAMTGKGAETNKSCLADLAVAAVRSIAKAKNNAIAKNNVKQGDRKESALYRDAIAVKCSTGENTEKSELIHGVVIDKEIVHPAMPARIVNAKVALLDCPLEIRNTEIDAKIQITDPAQLNSFLEQEERTLKHIVETIAKSGAAMVFCERGIDDIAQHFLAKAGIAAVRRVRRSDMESLARATGGRIISSWKDLVLEDLGSAGLLREEKVGGEKIIFVEKCADAQALTLLVRGSTPHVAEEIRRAVTDAIGDVAAALNDGKAVAGAGSVEMELAQQLRKYAAALTGREQLAVHAFADAIEVIPRTLAENAGLNPLDVLVSLRAAHQQGQQWAGIDVSTGKVMDAWQNGVIEPLKIKTQALRSAVDVAEMILRIDDVIMGGKGNDLHSRPTPAEGVE